MRRSAVLVVVLGLALAASAGVRAERWYQVELVAFERSSPDVRGEQFPASAELPVPARSVELLDPGTADAFAEAGAAGLPVAFAPLGGSALELAAVAGALARDPGYQVLRHVAWRQPGFGVEGAPAVHLLALGAPRPPEAHPVANGETAMLADAVPPASRLEGFVALRVGRYLYLDVDLLYRTRDAAATLSEHRRLRLGELHYFDHPLYGVLAAVYPVDLPGPADTGSGDAAGGSGATAEGGGEQPAQPRGATPQLGLDGRH